MTFSTLNLTFLAPQSDILEKPPCTNIQTTKLPATLPETNGWKCIITTPRVSWTRHRWRVEVDLCTKEPRKCSVTSVPRWKMSKKNVPVWWLSPTICCIRSSLIPGRNEIIASFLMRTMMRYGREKRLIRWGRYFRRFWRLWTIIRSWGSFLQGMISEWTVCKRLTKKVRNFKFLWV